MKTKKTVFYVLIAVIITLSFASCDNFMDLWKSWGVNNDENENDGDNGINPEVFIVDVSDETGWNYMIYWSDGASLFFDADETEAVPIRMFYKPDSESDEGLTFLFYENGFPHMVEYNDHLLYFANFGGNYMDMAVIDPDGEIDYEFDIETNVNWNAFIKAPAEPEPLSASRSVREVDVPYLQETIGIMELSLDVVCDAITTWKNPIVGAITVVSKQIPNPVVETITTVAGLFGGPVLTTIQVGITTAQVSIGVVNNYVNEIERVVAIIEGRDYDEIRPEPVLPELTGSIDVRPNGTEKVGVELTARYWRTGNVSFQTNVSYQWIKNGDPIPGATGETYKTTEPGIYSVIITAPGYQNKTSNDRATVTSTGNPVVSFSPVLNVDGSVRQTTTRISIGFFPSGIISYSSLTPDNFTLSGIEGAKIDRIESYYLYISGFESGGMLTVTIGDIPGYEITNSTRQVLINHADDNPNSGLLYWTAVPQTTVFGTNTISRIKYVGDKFFAFNDFRMAYSYDGITWIQSSHVFADITYGNGRYVAAPRGNTSFYSDDGITWISEPSNTSLSSVTYGYVNGVGVFLGGVGYRMANSYDGINWVLVPDTITEPIFRMTGLGGSISYAQIDHVVYGVNVDGVGRFVYTAHRNNRIVYTDGTFDTLTRVSAVSNTTDIAYGNGMFVTVGESLIGFSDDARTWSRVSDRLNPYAAVTGVDPRPRSVVSSVAYGNGRFVTGGQYGKMAYSEDGKSWYEITDSAFETHFLSGSFLIDSFIQGIAYGNGRFVAVGNNGRISYVNW